MAKMVAVPAQTLRLYLRPLGRSRKCLPAPVRRRGATGPAGRADSLLLGWNRSCRSASSAASSASCFSGNQGVRRWVSASRDTGRSAGSPGVRISARNWCRPGTSPVHGPVTPDSYPVVEVKGAAPSCVVASCDCDSRSSPRGGRGGRRAGTPTAGAAWRKPRSSARGPAFGSAGVCAAGWWRCVGAVLHSHPAGNRSPTRAR